jgi:bifunctional non-homologous end joining protein LigD
VSSKHIDLTVGRYTVTVSNPDKILYPADGFTKSDVIGYYGQIADTILPHLKDRALTLKRYPNGVESEFFYEKNCPSHRPDFVKTLRIVASGTIDYCTVNDIPTLLWVANLASLELHVLLSRGKNNHRPTMIMFDLDPGAPADVLDCARVAIEFHEMLEHLGLQSFVKTSGSKGLHLLVPLHTATTFEKTKPFAHALAMLMEQQDPARVTSIMKRDLRGGKVFVDWSQNDEHKTTVCAYSMRGTQHPSVSTPMTWDEVKKAAKKGDQSAFVFTPADVLKRVKKNGDLLAGLLTLKQKLPILPPAQP